MFNEFKMQEINYHGHLQKLERYDETGEGVIDESLDIFQKMESDFYRFADILEGEIEETESKRVLEEFYNNFKERIDNSTITDKNKQILRGIFNIHYENLAKKACFSIITSSRKECAKYILRQIPLINNII